MLGSFPNDGYFEKSPEIINTSSIYVCHRIDDRHLILKFQDTFVIFHDSQKDSVTDECYNDEDSSSHHSYYHHGVVVEQHNIIIIIIIEK